MAISAGIARDELYVSSLGFDAFIPSTGQTSRLSRK